jgi:hypothetical protein
MIWVCPSSLSHHQLASYFQRYHGFILKHLQFKLTTAVADLGTARFVLDAFKSE